MSGGTSISDDDRAQAAEYVLGLLDAPIARAFEDRMQSEPALREAVAQWAEDFAGLTDAIPPVAPDAHVWTGVTDRLFGAPEKPSFWARIGVKQIMLGAAAAAAIAFAVIDSGFLRPEVAPEFRAEIAGEAQVAFRAEYDSDSGQLTLIRTGQAASEGRSHEIWLIADGNAPVSVMVWPDGKSSETLLLTAPLAAALPRAILAVSDEPQGGSPTGAPTGAVLATGQVQPI